MSLLGQRLIILAVTLPLALIILAIESGGIDLCSPMQATAAPKQGGPAACFVEFWLNRYQTLITGILAFGGAAATVWFIRKQIEQVDNLDARRRAQENYAARAILPIALGSICEYAEKCIRSLKEFDPEKDNVSNLNLPSLPPDLIEPLRECIRYSDQPHAKQIADLLHWLQVQSARQKGLHADLESKDPTRIITRLDIDIAIIDAGDLYALASRLFDYGRRTEEGREARPSLQEVNLALANCGIWDHERPKMYEYLERTRR